MKYVIFVVVMLLCIEANAQVHSPLSGSAAADHSVALSLDSHSVLRASLGARHLMRRAPGRKFMRDQEYHLAIMQDLVLVARENGIPIHLFVVLIYRESSFMRYARGLKGEHGFGQVMHPKMWGCDMSTRVGNLRCSARYLARGYKKCGSWHGALSHYQSRTAACKPLPETFHARAVARRVRNWRKLQRLFPLDKHK